MGGGWREDGGPSSLTWGLRASRVGSAPCSTQSSAISDPELPQPTTRTFLPTHPSSVALVYRELCTTLPLYTAMSAKAGMIGSL